MPVALEWHPDLPVLLATYSGDLSIKDYRTMLDQRLRMVADGPDQIIFVADTRQFDTFSDSRNGQLGENILIHDKVAHTFVILEGEFYRRLLRAMRTDLTLNYAVYFFDSVDQALSAAQTQAKKFG